MVQSFFLDTAWGACVHPFFIRFPFYLFLYLSPFLFLETSWLHTASYGLICLQRRPSAACKASRRFNNSINACECAGQVSASDLKSAAKRFRSSLLRTVVQRNETSARNTALHYEADGRRISTTAPWPILEEFCLDIRVVLKSQLSPSVRAMEAAFPWG